MAENLTGFSALLQRRIAAREQYRRGLAASGIELPTDEQLEQLRHRLASEMAAKRIVIFATSHDIQDRGHQLNAELEARLSFLSDKFAATVLMEEWATDRGASFASEFASRRNLAYTNVGTPTLPEFQTLSFAPINYPGHHGTLGPCEGAPGFWEYGPLENQENRERRMSQNIQEAMTDHKTGIFIVGLAHLHSMFSKLNQANLNVAAYSWFG